MKTASSKRRDRIGTAIAGLRILLAAYFFAIATQVPAAFSGGIAAYSDALPQSLEAVIFAAGACVAAVWALFARLPRTSGMILAGYVLWANLLHATAPADLAVALTALVRDMALVGALVMVAQASGLAPAEAPKPAAVWVRPTPARVILARRPPAVPVDLDPLEEDFSGLGHAVNALAMRRSA